MNEIEVKQENFADVASGGPLGEENGAGSDGEMVVGIDEDHIKFLTSMASGDDDSLDCPPEVERGGDAQNQFDEDDEDVMAAAESILQKTAKRTGGGGGGQQFYNCEYCNKTFTWLKSLTVHLRTHTNVKPYKCELCDRSFVRSDYLKYHIIKSHETTEQVFTCGACGGVFATNRGLLRHVRTEHDGHPTGDDELRRPNHAPDYHSDDPESYPEMDADGKFSCSYCDECYESRPPLVQHMHRHLGEKPFRCDLCPKSFIRVDFLQCHRSNHLKTMDYRQNGQLAGPKRPRISLKKLEDLVPSASASRPESSDDDDGGRDSDEDGADSSDEDNQQNQQLPQSEEQRSLLAALLTQVQRTENDRYQCPRCEKTFTQESTLKVHLRTHTGITPFQCPLCDLAFIRSDYLKNHLKKHIEDNGEDPGAPGAIDPSTFAFSGSSSTYASGSGTGGGGGSVSLLKPLSARPQSTGISLLKPPEERKPPDQPEYCIRTEDGKFMCTACERVFSHQQTVRIHYRIHTNEKPYKCPSCPESFIRSDYLERHMKVHWKDGPMPPMMPMPTMKAFPSASVGASDSSDSTSPQKPTIGRAGLMPENYHFVEAGDGQYACKICDQVFHQSDSLRKHALTHTDEKPFFCDVCDRSFNRVDYLKEHFKSKRHRQALAEANGDAMAMEEDDDSMTDTSLTGRMAKIKSPISPMTNAIADRMEFQRTDDGRYKCTDCDKTFVTAVTLKMHLRLHTGEKPYKCSRCSMAFIRSDYLKTHEKIHRQEAYMAGRQLYSADQSMAGSGDEYDEERDEDEMNGMAPLVKQDPELIIEAPAHVVGQEDDDDDDDDDGPDEDGEEEEESEDEQVIEVMVKEEDSDDDDDEEEQGGEEDQNDDDEDGEEEEEHENNNSYENEDSTSRVSGGAPSEQSGPRSKHRCHLCKKEFAWPKSLKIHLRTHTGERPYECEICGKSFTRSDSLKAHRNTHGDVRVLQCHLCDASFVNGAGLIRHQKNEHGIEPLDA